jgi:hypothetical protein
MTDNVLIAIIASSGVVISALCVFGGGIFALVANNKRLDRIENTLMSMQSDLKEFYRMHVNLEAKVDAKK